MPIDVFVLGKDSRSYLIFHKDASLRLREHFRLCPRLIGSYSNLASKTQTTISSIPAQLTHHEVCLLVDKCPREIRLFESINFDEEESLSEMSLNRFKCEYENYALNFREKQHAALREARKQQLLSMREKILDGKRKKLNARLERCANSLGLDSNNDKLLNEKCLMIRSELEKLEQSFNLDLEKMDLKTGQLSEESLNTEIFVHTPDFYAFLFDFSQNRVSIDDFYLRNCATFATCKYKALKYFWLEGYYLTNGSKFGGDFLVYQGDPAKFHSQFILVCLESLEHYLGLELKQLITYARMATSVKKTFLLAVLTGAQDEPVSRKQFSICLDSEHAKEYLCLISLNWSHI